MMRRLHARFHAIQNVSSQFRLRHGARVRPQPVKEISLSFFFRHAIDVFAHILCQNMSSTHYCHDRMWLAAFFLLLIVPMFNPLMYDATTSSQISKSYRHLHEIPCTILISTFWVKNPRKYNSRFNIRLKKCGNTFQASRKHSNNLFGIPNYLQNKALAGKQRNFWTCHAHVKENEESKNNNEYYGCQ